MGLGTEHIMQYIWQWRLYGSPDKALTDGTPLRIVYPGRLNTASGPDFSDARLTIGSVAWAGNVELHVRASDWYRHGHNRDRAYDSVILHVVGESDTLVTRPDGSYIPQLLLPFSAETAQRFRILGEGGVTLRCASWLRDVPQPHRCDWLQRMGMERLETKGERLLDYVRQTGGDWNQALFIALSRALGFGLNSDPLERVGRSLPHGTAARHADSVFQLEALLMGQAGLLEGDSDDTYFKSLADEYSFLAHKYGLTPLERGIWKLSGIRPAGMPYRRLALLARMLQGGTALFSRIIEAKEDPQALAALFDTDFTGSYWERHLCFGRPTSRTYRKAMSPAMTRILLVNLAAPLLYAYGRYTGHTPLEEEGHKLLMKLPPESNSITRSWAAQTGIKARDSFESQALLHLKNEYCDKFGCQRCRWGHRIIAQTTAG